MKLPESPPKMKDLINTSDDSEESIKISDVFSLLQTEAGKDHGKEYLHWDKLKYKPLPEGVSDHNTLWYLTKFRRVSAFRKLPLKAKDDSSFVYWLPDPIQQRLHEVDQQASGRVEISEAVANPNSRDRYLVSSLIEEAITSSQLEGASTTHRVAKAMLREGRPPRNKSERMIRNNFQAMNFIREAATSPLTKELIFELHNIVVEDTLDDPTAVGRLRRDSDDVAVYDNRENTLLHMPPAANELEERLDLICKFANEDDENDEFLHPVVRSILLHFMLGYDHPFVDGNGRTARALFYWSMAKRGYWMMEFVSISTILKSSPAQYAKSYLYTENDDNDTTYFIDFNLRVILQAIAHLQRYLSIKAKEVKRVEQVLGSSLFAKTLNYRQIALISHAIRHPGDIYTIESHRKSHSVSYPTSRSDLLHLVDLGLLIQKKIKNAFAFKASNDIENKLLILKSKSG